MTHEFGHILGQTNLGPEMQTNHEDETHPKHCKKSRLFNVLGYRILTRNDKPSKYIIGTTN